jgi:phosphatidylserine/phosphatidylglycerophosphate/cardiolipin synthase-like enzyme
MLSDILDFSDRELGLLLDALSRGTIRPGGGDSQARKSGFPDRAEIVLAWLAEATDRFGSIQALSAAIKLILEDRSRSTRDGSQAELILTGPVAGDDSVRDTRVAVREIFESARHTVLIVGYAFYGSDRIFEPLARRMGSDPTLTTRIVVNIKPEPGRTPAHSVRRFADDFLRSNWPFHPRPRLYYLPDYLENQSSRRASVHAKVIVADRSTVYLGSANFTAAAFRRNIEAGIRIEDPNLARQLVDYFDRLINDGVLSPLVLGD